MVLNALAVDPRKTWKGPWRWYTESMLNCCVDLEEMKATGITLQTFACLARCQGLEVTKTLAADSTVADFRESVKRACVEDSVMQEDTVGPFLVASYDRKVLRQTGSGHFSPIAAYDEESDKVLVLDTARFKYGAHWVPLPLMFEATLPEDPDTGKSRGFVLLSFQEDEQHSGIPQSLLFQTSQTNHNVRKEYKDYLEGQKGSITWEDVLSYWTRDGANDNYVWDMTKLQLNPTDKKGQEAVASMRKLIYDLMPGSDTLQHVRNDCGDNTNRVICLAPQEAVFVVYLASLDEQKRRDIVLDADSSEPPETKQQLLAEAKFLQLAIEMSDELNVGSDT